MNDNRVTIVSMDHAIGRRHPLTMDTTKLFHVLVVGGALLAGCREDQAGDAGAGADAGMAADAPAAGEDAGDLVECGFCPNPDCCVTEPSGESHERPGMVCCWSTSC
jgi:hypothetical protein